MALGLAGARSLPQALGRASGLGLAIALAGCGLALGLNLPPGPLIACCCLAVLVGSGHLRPRT